MGRPSFIVAGASLVRNGLLCMFLQKQYYNLLIIGTLFGTQLLQIDQLLLMYNIIDFLQWTIKNRVDALQEYNGTKHI